MKVSERIIWLMIGAAVGAGIALLYAPRTGKETRKIIRRKAEDARDTIVETSEQIRDTIVERGEQILEAGRDVYRRGAGFATTAAAGAAGIFEAGRRVVK